MTTKPSSPYAGTIVESAVDTLITEFGRLVENAGEVGFVLVYHAVNEPGTSGVMDLVGSGISNAQLRDLFAEAAERDLTHNCTR